MTSLRDVKDFRYMTRQRNIAALIDIVEVNGDASDFPSFNALQKFLCRATNITCLSLVFSCRPALRILPTTLFNNLTDLNTNAPHTAVAQFLIQHSSLTSLAVGACHTSLTSVCPLTHSPLHLLESLTCPSDCVRAMASMATPLTNLTVIHIVG
jgi:hypothetical protein